MNDKCAAIAIIGGTGLYEFEQGRVVGDKLTPFGETPADIVLSTIGKKSVAFLARHGVPHTIAPHSINYRANLWALKQLGVESVIAVNAVGGIRADLPPGCLVIPDQLIDYSYGRAHSFYQSDSAHLMGSALEHCDFCDPFSERLRLSLFRAAEHCQLALKKKGVYAVTQGPRLETAAEIDRLERDGCDIVGMTAMPEAVLARELGIDYASLCLVVNPAAGRSDGPVTMEAIHSVLEGTMDSVRKLLVEVVALL